jgi:hypothetical protein
MERLNHGLKQAELPTKKKKKNRRRRRIIALSYA